VARFIIEDLEKAAGMSTLTQNPDWPVDADGTADYKYDCE